MNTETLYMMALSLATKPTAAIKNELVKEYTSATKIYQEHKELLEPMLPHLKHEMEWVEQNKIQCISILDENYPQFLRQCPDAPLMLFYRGNADLNSQHIISMVGTRKISEYGKQMCEHFLRELSEIVPDVIVFSGLAYGVDIHCHRASLEFGLKTIGVLAHGLDQIYPSLHRDTAVKMLRQGGLLSEYPSGTKIDKRNFVQRNRIVAGCSQATIVVESATKGGSLITARLARDYDREVFAVPGRLTDPVSSGCNQLIASNTANILVNAEQFVEAMGWDKDLTLKKRLQDGIQQDLFTHLDTDKKKIAEILRNNDRVALNTLATLTGIQIGQLRTMVFEMEMAGIIKALPGNSFRLV